MKILVLGSTGALGTALETIANISEDIEIIGLSHADFEITDSQSLEKIISSHSPDVVINAVALIGINICEDQSDRAFAINATAPSEIAKICEKLGITLVQPSSHAVFDGDKDGYYTEEDEVNPVNIYAASKYAGECFARNICSKYYVVRFPTMFGPRRNQSPGFVDKMLDRIVNKRPIKAPDDKIDSLTYTLDAASTIINLVRNQAPYGTYHLANSGAVSFYDFVCYLADSINKEAEIAVCKDADFPSLGLKPLKTAMKSVKLPAMRTWQQALKDYLDTYILN